MGLLQEVLDGLVEDAGEGGGMEADPEDQKQERGEGEDLAQVQVQ
jgi:hypothetical protein